MWSGVGLRKHLYEHNLYRWWNPSWAISNPKRWCCESVALNMPANLENSSGHKTGKGQFSFQSQRKALPKKCSNYCTIALISHTSKVKLKILQARLHQYMNQELPDVQAGFRKGRGARDQIANICWIIEKNSSRKTSTSALLTMPKPLTVLITTNWKILQEMGIPYHLICLLRNLYAGQEATVRTGHGTTDWFQIGKGVRQGCILSPCLFNFYAEYIMRNAGLDEAQAGIKIPRRNINSLKYADDITLMAESEELKSLLMKLKEESEKVGFSSTFRKLRSCHPVPSSHDK